MKNIKNYLWYVIFIVIVIFITYPFIMDKVIIGNKFNINSNISADGWSSFFGGYIGAGIALITILITLKSNKEQFKKDKRLNHKPLLKVDIIKEIVNNDEVDSMINALAELKWNNCIHIKSNSNEKVIEKSRFKLVVKNIGIGNAIDFKVLKIYSLKEDNNIDISEDYYFFGALERKEEINLWLNIIYEKDKKYDSYIGREYKEDKNEFEKLKEKIEQETYKDIYIDFEYSDIFRNKYITTICLRSFINIDTVNSLGYVGGMMEDITREIKATYGDIYIIKEREKEKLVKES